MKALRTASKAPKSKRLSLIASTDYRYASVVRQKNIKESYPQIVAKMLTLSPGKHHSKQVKKIYSIKKRRQLTTASRAFKLRRMQLKKYRASLRYQRELSEGVTYKVILLY